MGTKEDKMSTEEVKKFHGFAVKTGKSFILDWFRDQNR